MLPTQPCLYDRYTFYRLLAQMSVDSSVQESNKLYFADYLPHYTNRMHLFYQNPFPNAQTNLVTWTNIDFFMGAADRMLRASLDLAVTTNGRGATRTSSSEPLRCETSFARRISSCSTLMLDG